LKGRKYVVFGGIILYAISSLLCAISFLDIMLIGFRVLQGLGSSLLISNIYAIPKDFFPKDKQGKAIGMITLGVYIGLTFGPFLGGYLIDYFSWNWIFVIGIPIGIISFIIIYKTYNIKESHVYNERFDYLGAFFLALLLVSLYLILTFGNKIGWTNNYIIIFMIILLFSIPLFVFTEKRAKNPMIHLKLFRNLDFTISNLIALIFYITTMSISFLIPLELKAGFGYFGLTIALIIFPMPLMMSIFTPISGILSDKYMNKKISLIGLIILSISFLLLGLLKFTTPISYFILIISGIGQGLFRAPNVGMILDSVEPKERGLASSLASMMRTIGQSSSFAISTAILGLFIPFNLLNAILSGTITPTSEQFELFVSSVQIVFFIMFIIVIATIILISLQFVKGKKLNK